MNIKPSSPPHQQVLDPRFLGRPVHLLPLFTARLREDLAELFRAGMNRRYRAAFEVSEIGMACIDEPEHAGRWLRYEAPSGGIGFAIERSVLLGAIHYRYGTREAAPADKPAQPPARETATEERLAATLGAQFAAAVAARIDGWPGTATEACEFRAAGANPPPIVKAWTIKASIAESKLGIHGNLWLTLDDAWMSRLLRQLAVPREAKQKDAAAGDAGAPLAQRLHLQLAGRLLQKEVPLGTLLDLQIGEVIPISLGPTEVLVEDARLFRAVVAERAGKLCLTSFEDVE
ncbi:MAG TPA: FliM/FliN family flagellar motor C-terminal domain-containing protein [Burkholderiaceae bacterium]|jgi:flagellar motor switch protein FliM